MRTILLTLLLTCPVFAQCPPGMTCPIVSVRSFAYQPRWFNHDGKSSARHAIENHNLNVSGMSYNQIRMALDHDHDTFGSQHTHAMRASNASRMHANNTHILPAPEIIVSPPPRYVSYSAPIVSTPPIYYSYSYSGPVYRGPVRALFGSRPIRSFLQRLFGRR